MDINELNVEDFFNKNYGRIFNFAKMAESYEDYAKNIYGRKVSLAIPTFDDLLGKIRPSQVVTFIGGTNVGKTALLMNICFHNAVPLQDGLIILMECEVDENEIYERALQMEFDLHTHEIETAYAKQDKALLEKFKSIRSKYSNIISVIHRVRTEEIIPYIKAIEKLYEKPCRLLLIDYVGLVVNQFKDDYAKITETMQKIKEVALHLQLPIIDVSQTSRADTKDKKGGIGLQSGKGSGEVENSSQVVISLNMVEEIESDIPQEVLDMCLKTVDNPKPSHYLLKAKIEKKKQGEYGDTYLLFNKRSLKLTDLKIKPDNKPF